MTGCTQAVIGQEFDFDERITLCASFAPIKLFYFIFREKICSRVSAQFFVGLDSVFPNPTANRGGVEIQELRDVGDCPQVVFVHDTTVLEFGARRQGFQAGKRLPIKNYFT